jgi:N utilization substance protein B
LGDKPKKKHANSVKIIANRGARLAAVQALFQVELTGKAGKKVLQEFLKYRLSDDEKIIDKTFANTNLFKVLVKSTIEDHIMIDAQLSARLASGWTLERIDPIALASLRLATYELLNCLETPIAVIIDEYVGIVAAFHEGPEAGFVNGILDKIAKETKADLAREAQ